MSGDEPRRSVRSNKGQHKNASTSPAPAPKPIKASKAKSSKKSLEPEPEPEDEDEDEEDEEIRCICGNSDRKDKRPFIACDACSVWQHNICMGIPDDEDDVPEHYFCELCRPEEHQETLRALSLHEKIWETRNKIYQNERKMSKNRKNRSKPGGEATPGWLKKDLPVSETSQTTEHPTNESTTSAKEEPVAQDGGQESGTKRKREETKEEEEEDSLDQTDKTNDKSLQNDRQEKRRKSSVIDSKAAMDPETALVSLDQLPPDRKKVATALSQIIFNDVLERVKTSAFVMPEGQSAKSIGEHWAVRIEYALQMNHGNTKAAAYITQFRALLANLKRNHSLLERLLDHSLTPDQLSVMPTNEMASEELQRERAELKQALDRQAVAISEEGPKYRQDHKGYHAIEDETRHLSDNRPPTPLPTTAASGSPPDKDVQAPRQSQSQEPSGSPTISRQQHLDDDEKQAADHSTEQQASGQQFDMNNIWAKTAQSPTANTTTPQGVRRSSQIAPRRSNSVQIAPTQSVGAKDDPDVDRMLEDNDEAYSPIATTSEDTIVWRGKLVQNGEDTAPVLNARFVAGRDLVGTVSWQDLLPTALSIDGRLQIQKAEDYLCGLRWSSSSDVSVLSLTPHDNAEAFNKAFEYFHSRQRYAVVEKGKPPMVKELYIIPVEIGSHLPEHIEMLEHCTIKKPVEERLLLASLTVVRAPEEMTSVPADTTPNQQTPSGVNGSIPHHVRHSLSGPAGSPINGQTPFSPSNNGLPVAGYGANTNGAPSPATASYGQNSFPPNPYGAPMQQANPLYMSPQQGQGSTQGPDPRVNEILGDLQFTPTASQIIRASPHITPQQLHSMRQILIDNPHTRNDIAAFQAILSG